jgi:MFS family permease
MKILVKQRISLSAYFFVSGLCFSSWASRIPTMKTHFGLNEAELGTILLTLPVSSFIGLPISGWLVDKFDSRWPLLWGFIFLPIFLFLIGLSETIFFFVLSIFFFALANRIANIAMNTQAINLQNLYTRKINGSFHGLWSLGGIAGVGITTMMIAFGVGIETHFLIVASLVLLISLFSFKYVLKKDKSNVAGGFSLKKPEPLIMKLGFLIFFAAICEGTMFDWSGIYFKEVVGVEIFTAGYLIFMASMTLSRFLSDGVIHRIGMERVFMFSSLLVFSGMSLAVAFPYFWPALIGFMIVGVGTAAVVPMAFTLAGTSKRYSPGIALSMIATFGLVGFMIGPPLIGFLAHAMNLRVSFIFVAIMGLMILPTSINYFKKQKSHAPMAEVPNLGEL